MRWFPPYESREIAWTAAWRIQCYAQKIWLSIKKGNVIKWKWFERRTRITRIDWEETLHWTQLEYSIMLKRYDYRLKKEMLSNENDLRDGLE